MKLILDISIVDQTGQAHWQAMRKELDTKVVPPPGVHYSDPQWRDEPKVPTAVILHVEEDWCLLKFDDDEYLSPEAFQYAIDAYHANGWKRPSKWPL